MTVAQELSRAEELLRSKSVPEPSANAEFLMAHVLKTGRAELRLHAARVLTERQGLHFRNLLQERVRRVPLAYVLGTQPFLGLEIEVGPGVLVPRPETEELVSAAIELFDGRRDDPLHIVEIGTGTGCIAIALSTAFPHATIYATDISPAALKLALRNAEAHHRSSRIRFINEDFFRLGESGRQGWADLVISNPPYIPSGEISRLEPEVRHEPRVALDGGPDGLQGLRAIIAPAARLLKPKGWAALEIGHDQGPAVSALLAAAGFKPEIRRDAQGLERIAIGKVL